MNYSKWILGAALLFSAQIASVQGDYYHDSNRYHDGGDSCDPCNSCCGPTDLCDIDFCDMQFSVYVDFLWWQVCRSDLDFDDDGDTRFINPDYHPGWRIGGVARWNNWDFGVRYTSFDYDQDDNDDRFHRWDFDNVDIEAGYICCLDCVHGYLRPFAGAKLAWIDEKKGDDDDDDEKLDFHGYGLYLGLEGRFRLCEWCWCDKNIPIDFVARGSTSILHSKFKFGGDSDDDDGDECVYVPVHDLFVGIDFTICGVCGWDTYLGIGYEIQDWTSWRTFDADDDLATLGFGGLVLRFGASF